MGNLKQNIGYFDYENMQIPIFVVPNFRAKRLILRLCPAKKNIRVTVPLNYRASLVLSFVKAQANWLYKHLSQQQSPNSLQSILYLGNNYQIVHQASDITKVFLCEVARTLTIHSPEDRVQPVLMRWLTVQAAQLLPEIMNKWTDRVGVSITRLAIKDTKRQWGSCSKDGHISLSWRLILMPQEVAEYICIHELCHRLEMNHSPRFWQNVARFSPNYLSHKKWLKTNGRHLHF